MTMRKSEDINDRKIIWARCGRCGHKLFKLAREDWHIIQVTDLEIKCSSCRTINRLQNTHESL